VVLLKGHSEVNGNGGGDETEHPFEAGRLTQLASAIEKAEPEDPAF